MALKKGPAQRAGAAQEDPPAHPKTSNFVSRLHDRAAIGGVDSGVNQSQFAGASTTPSIVPAAIHIWR